MLSVQFSYCHAELRYAEYYQPKNRHGECHDTLSTHVRLFLALNSNPLSCKTHRLYKQTLTNEKQLPASLFWSVGYGGGRGDQTRVSLY